MAAELPMLPPRLPHRSVDSNRNQSPVDGAPPPLPLRKTPTLPAITPDVLAPLETNERKVTAAPPVPARSRTTLVADERNDTSPDHGPALPARNATWSSPLRTSTLPATPVKVETRPIPKAPSAPQREVNVQSKSARQSYAAPTRFLSYVLREPVEQTQGRMLMLAPIPKAFGYISKLPPSPAPLASLIDSSLLGAQLMLHDKQTRRKALAPTVLALACTVTVMACIPSPRWMSWLRYMILLSSLYLGPRHIMGVYPIGALAAVGAVFNIEAVMICISVLYSSSILLTRFLEKRDGWNPNTPAQRGFGTIRTQEGWRPVALDVVQNTSDWWRWRSSDEERSRRKQKKEAALERKELKRTEEAQKQKGKEAAAELKRTLDATRAEEKLAKDQEVQDMKAAKIAAVQSAKEEKRMQAEAKARLAADEKAEKQRVKQETEDCKRQENSDRLERKRMEAKAAQAEKLRGKEPPLVVDSLTDAPRDEILSTPPVSGEDLRLAMEAERMRQEQRRLEG